MKKRVFLIATAVFLIGARSLSQQVIDTPNATTSISHKAVNSVIDHLIAEGYSESMIHDLFGVDNHYFPVDSDKLESVMFMIDMLIEEGKYEETEKTVMIFLAFDAHRLAQEEAVGSATDLTLR